MLDSLQFRPTCSRQKGKISNANSVMYRPKPSYDIYYISSQYMRHSLSGALFFIMIFNQRNPTWLHRDYPTRICRGAAPRTQAAGDPWYLRYYFLSLGLSLACWTQSRPTHCRQISLQQEGQTTRPEARISIVASTLNQKNHIPPSQYDPPGWP